MKNPLRLNAALIAAAQAEAAIQRRSVPNQIEYWAELGKAVEHVLQLPDVYAIIQGIKKISVEPVVSSAIDPEGVWSSIEQSRASGALSEKVTSASVYYESSLTRPGLLDKVNASTGARVTGQFVNGKFIQA